MMTSLQSEDNINNDDDFDDYDTDNDDENDGVDDDDTGDGKVQEHWQKGIYERTRHRWVR